MMEAAGYPERWLSPINWVKAQKTAINIFTTEKILNLM
jgi:hypothetical protein